MHDDCVECTACLLESQCIDSILKTKEIEMTKRSVRIRRSKVGAKPPVVEEPVEEPVVEEPVEEPVVEETEVAEQDLSEVLSAGDVIESEELVMVDYAGNTITELRDLCTDRDVSAVGRKSVLIKRLKQYDDQFGVTGEAKVEAETDEIEIAEPTAEAPVDDVKSVPMANVTGLLMELDVVMSALRNGEVLNITKIGGGMYVLSHGSDVGSKVSRPVDVPGKPQVPVLKGMAWREEVQTLEHFKWMYKDTGNGTAWHDMTVDAKYEFAEEVGAEWDVHETERVDIIRMVRAVKAKLGLEIYKPEYQSRTVRNALRGR